MPPKPKLKRLPRRKTVTLIAAFKCAEDQFVICADSQETAGHYRVARQKIDPFMSGNFQLAIGGSGRNGDLIDAFVKRVETNLANKALKTTEELEGFLHRELLDFRNNETSAYPRRDRSMEFIIAATSQESGLAVWNTKASRLIPVKEYAVMGWVEPYYEHIVKRLYRPNMPVMQGIFLGLYLMDIASKTSNYVNGPVTLVVARKTGLWMEPSDNFSKLAERVSLFSSQIDSMLLACPDTSLYTETFKEQLREFGETVLRLREEYLMEAAEDLAQRVRSYHSPYPAIPPGTLVLCDENEPGKPGNVRYIEPGKVRPSISQKSKPAK
jgi:20S proteasome alpha/beta subunit